MLVCVCVCMCVCVCGTWVSVWVGVLGCVEMCMRRCLCVRLPSAYQRLLVTLHTVQCTHDEQTHTANRKGIYSL